MEGVQEEDKVDKKKITQLLLNTPGVCFLCLKDNGRDEGVEPVEDLNGGIIDLSTICRYLRIDQCSLLSTSLESDGGSRVADEVEREMCSFSVNLCPKCLESTKKLTDMIIQLEKAKLLVNFHLRSFHKLLEGDEEWEESLEWINLLGRMHANPTNSFEAKLVQLLREETRDKSFEILRKAEAVKPQVILSKFPAPPPASSSLETRLPFNPSWTTAAGSTSIKTLLSDHITTSSIPSSKKTRKSKPHLCRCPYCNKILTQVKFTVHLSCLHSDKLLSSYFPPALPPSEEICRQVLYSQVIAKAAKITSPSTPTAPPRLGCHLCGITYSDGNLLKQHFLVTHTDQLCEEIHHFEKNPQKLRKMKSIKIETLTTTTIKTRLSCPPPPQVPYCVEDHIKNLQRTSLIIPSNNDSDNTPNAKVVKKYQCPFCENSLNPYRFARHLANLHPDKLLAPFITTSTALDKLKDDNPNQFSQLCRKVLATQLSKAAKIPVTTPGGEDDTPSSSSASKLCCHLCTKTYSDSRNLKYHLLVEHNNHLCDQLIKMQNVKMGLQDKKKKKKMVDKKVKPLKDKPLEIQPLEIKPALEVQPLKKSWRRSAEEKTCSICSQAFTQVGKLRRHQVNQHPDQLFLNCKSVEMGDKQFWRLCKEIFREEVKDATFGRRSEKIYKCGYCPLGGETSYKGSEDLLVHLVYQHRESMEGKLRHGQDKVKVEKMEVDTDAGDDNFYFEANEDHIFMEEEVANELDLKPDIGEFGELFGPRMHI